MLLQYQRVPFIISMLGVLATGSALLYLTHQKLTYSFQSSPPRTRDSYVPWPEVRAIAERIQPENVIRLELRGVGFGYSTLDKPITITDKRLVSETIQALAHAEYRSQDTTVASNLSDTLKIYLKTPIPHDGSCVELRFRASTAGWSYGPRFKAVLKKLAPAVMTY